MPSYISIEWFLFSFFYFCFFKWHTQCGKQGKRFFIVPETGYGPEYPFSGEKLSVVMTLYRAKDIDEAIRISNGTAYGLSSGVCTNRLDYITRFVSELEVGSVNVRDMADGLIAQGHQVDKRQIIMGAPIKTLGMFDVTVALPPEVRVTVKANVARSDDEAELQRQGVDVLGNQAEEERAETEGFTEELDPNRELGELPPADEDEVEGA